MIATNKSARCAAAPRVAFRGLAGPSLSWHLRGHPPHCKGRLLLSFRDVGVAGLEGAQGSGHCGPSHSAPACWFPSAPVTQGTSSRCSGEPSP